MTGINWAEGGIVGTVALFIGIVLREIVKAIPFRLFTKREHDRDVSDATSDERTRGLIRADAVADDARVGGFVLKTDCDTKHAELIQNFREVKAELKDGQAGIYERLNESDKALSKLSGSVETFHEFMMKKLR